jgi:hypothetical protein
VALSDAISHLARRAGEAATGYISGADVIATVAQIYADLSARGFTLDRPRLSGYVDGVVDGVARMRAYVADGSARHDFVIQRLPANGTPVTILRLDADTGALEIGAPTGPTCAARLVDLSTMHGTILGEIAATVTETVYRPTWSPTWATVHNAVLVRSGGSVALTADITSAAPVSGANVLGDIPLGFRPDAESGMIQDQSAVETTGSKSAVVMVRGGSGAYAGLYRLGSDWGGSRWRFRATWRTVDTPPTPTVGGA